MNCWFFQTTRSAYLNIVFNSIESDQFFNLAAFLTKKRQITSLGVLYFKELWNLENLGIAQLDKLSWQAYNLDSTRASWIIV